MFLLYALACLVLCIYLVGRFLLRGPNVAAFDRERFELASEHREASTATVEVRARARAFYAAINAAPLHRRLATARALLDEGLTGEALTADALDVSIHPVDTDGVRGEWVCAPASDPDKRLLYLHGGGFTLGSPRSHRYVTSRLAHLCGMSVFVADYARMPESSRRRGIEDCRRAYRLLANGGPAGAGAAQIRAIAGDSAGGNLALMLNAWCHAERLPPPHAVVGFSPLTDSTLAGPSVRGNLESDFFLGPGLARIVALPRALLAVLTCLTLHMRPQDPRISPLYGDLGGLSPTLLQASTAELLRDDAVRYVGKAHAAGTHAELQLWPDMPHAWQLFGPLLPEADEALARAAAFVLLCASLPERPSVRAEQHSQEHTIGEDLVGE